ncbi:hypothetical protein [Serratia fonticola]
MKKKLFSLGLLLLAVSSSATAVDGYKGVKFGSNFNELKAAKMCSWKKLKDDVKGMSAYYCDDFKFIGEKSKASAFFINEKFERFAVVLGENTDVIFDSLLKKYGLPSFTPTDEEMKRYELLGGKMNFKFDNDTVIVLFILDVAKKIVETELIYTSTKFDALYKELRQKSLENDI